jgi:hypothetical protein
MKNQTKPLILGSSLTRLELTKWAGTGLLIAATTVRALNLGHGLDVVLSFLGVACWLAVGILIKDKPLAVVNGFSVVILTYGLMRI